MPVFTEAELMREGAWGRTKRCYDVGDYHVSVKLSSLDPWDFHVAITKVSRLVFTAIVQGPMKAGPPRGQDFFDAATTAMNEAVRLMLVDQPSLGQEAVFTGDGSFEPATFYMNAPC